MANKNRVFVSFAMEDKVYRDFLIGQARNRKSPFEFINMSVSEPWDTQWKSRCRTRIKGCDGMIALVSRNTSKAAGALWEIKCAKEEGIPLVAIYCNSIRKPAYLPRELSGVRVLNWTWVNIGKFMDRL
jgi:hypothetical protein